MRNPLSRRTAGTHQSAARAAEKWTLSPGGRPLRAVPGIASEAFKFVCRREPRLFLLGALRAMKQSL